MALCAAIIISLFEGSKASQKFAKSFNSMTCELLVTRSGKSCLFRSFYARNIYLVSLSKNELLLF